MGQTLQQAELRRSLSKMQGLLGTSAGECCSKRAPARCRSSTLGAELKRGWAPCQHKRLDGTQQALHGHIDVAACCHQCPDVGLAVIEAHVLRTIEQRRQSWQLSSAGNHGN